MSGCRDFGEWARAVRGELSGREGYDAAAHLAGCESCRAALADARRLDRSFRAPEREADSLVHPIHDDDVALAAAIARREFPPDAWTCEDCTELLVASIASTREAAADPRRGEIRRRLRTGPVTGVLAAAAAIIAGLVAFGPPSEPWARTAGLRREQVWRLPSSIARDVERVVANGELAPPRFTLPQGGPEMERNPAQIAHAPCAAAPRWEAVREVRPEFRWAGGDASRAEVFLLDHDRRFLHSFESSEPGRLSYPESAPPLTPGASYYWKVNVLGGVEIRPSEYAGFAVLGDGEAEECEQRLRRARGSAFVEAVVAERCGLYSEAAAAFDRAAERASEPEVAARLAREIRHRQGLDDKASCE